MMAAIDVRPTVLPFERTSPGVPSVCLMTPWTVAADSAVGVAALPPIVALAVIVYVPSGSVLPALSTGVQPTGIVPADCLPRSSPSGHGFDSATGGPRVSLPSSSKRPAR